MSLQPAPRNPEARPPRRRSSGKGPKRLLVNFLLWNMLPIGGLIVVGILWAQGAIQIEEPPQGTTQTLVFLAATTVALLLVASLSLPAAHRTTRSLAARQSLLLRTLTGRAPGNRFLALLGLPLILPPRILLELIRAALILLTLTLLTLALLAMVRLFQPTFLQPTIDALMPHLTR